jgi:hypothetical protein
LIGKIPHRWMAFVEVRGCAAIRISERRQAAVGGGTSRRSFKLAATPELFATGLRLVPNLALPQLFVRQLSSRVVHEDDGVGNVVGSSAMPLDCAHLIRDAADPCEMSSGSRPRTGSPQTAYGTGYPVRKA